MRRYTTSNPPKTARGKAEKAIMNVRDQLLKEVEDYIAEAVRGQLRNMTSAQVNETEDDILGEVSTAFTDSDVEVLGEINDLLQALRRDKPFPAVLEWMSTATEDALYQLTPSGQKRASKYRQQQDRMAAPFRAWLGFWPDSYDAVEQAIEDARQREPRRVA